MKHTCAIFLFLVITLCSCGPRHPQLTNKSESSGTSVEPVPPGESVPPTPDTSVNPGESKNPEPREIREEDEISAGLFKFGSDITHSSLSSDGQFIMATTSEGHIQVFDLLHGTVLKTFRFRSKVEWAHMNIKLKTFIVVYENNLVEIRTFPEGDIVKTIRPEVAISTCVLSPKADILVITFENNTGDIYDLKTNEILHTFEHQAKINDVVFSPKGTFLRSASDDGTSRLYDLTEVKLVSMYQPETFNEIKKIQISSDDRYHAFMGPEGQVEIMDITTSQKEMSEVMMSRHLLHSPLQFNESHNMYVEMGDEFIMFNPLFHARTSGWFFNETSCPAQDVLLSRNGSSMLVHCGGGILNLFTTPMSPEDKPELLQTITHTMPEIQNIWFHPDENFIITVSKNGFILVSSYQEGPQVVAVSTGEHSLYIDPYAHIDEVEIIKEEDIPRVDYFGLSDSFPHQHKLLGLAILAGGGLVYQKSLKVDAAATKIGKLLKITDQEARFAQAQRYFLNRGYSVTKAKSKANRLIQATPKLRSKIAHWGRRSGNLFMRGATKIVNFAAVLSWFYGMAEATYGSEPTINPLLVVEEQQLQHIKSAFEELEASPLNQKIQKKYIHDLTEVLKRKSQLLKLDYRVHVAEINIVLEARDQVSAAEVLDAETEFLEFRLEQTKKIYFIDSVYETLRNVSMLETLDAHDAEALVNETLKRLSE